MRAVRPGISHSESRSEGCPGGVRRKPVVVPVIATSDSRRAARPSRTARAAWLTITVRAHSPSDAVHHTRTRSDSSMATVPWLNASSPAARVAGSQRWRPPHRAVLSSTVPEEVFQRGRPSFDDPLTLSLYSFPSGPTAGTLLFTDGCCISASQDRQSPGRVRRNLASWWTGRVVADVSRCALLSDVLERQHGVLPGSSCA